MKIVIETKDIRGICIIRKTPNDETTVTNGYVSKWEDVIDILKQVQPQGDAEIS